MASLSSTGPERPDGESIAKIRNYVKGRIAKIEIYLPYKRMLLFGLDFPAGAQMIGRIAIGLAIAALPLAAFGQERDTGVRRAPQPGQAFRPTAQQGQGRDAGIRHVPQPDADFGVRQAPSAEHTITLRPGTMRQLQFEQPFTTVFVGDPNVVEPVANTNRSLSVRAKATGTTNLSAVNEVGEEIYNVVLNVVDVRQGGRVIVHAKKDSIHDVFAYQCSPNGCDRVEHKFDTLPPSPIIIQIPPLLPRAR